MATAEEEGRRRRRKNKPKNKRKDQGRKTTTTTTVHDLPAHLFEHILFLLGPSPWLVRAAAACRRWRRVVVDPGFLARFRSIHAPAPRVGDYYAVGDGPLFFPASPAAACFPLAADFSLGFLPDSGSWQLADSRGSLLLLSKKRTCRRASHDYYCRCPTNLVVCEPLTARYQGILWPGGHNGIHRLGVFLLDGGDADRHVGMSNFRVIAAVDQTVACVFSSGSDGGWRPVYSDATRDLQLPATLEAKSFVGRGNGSLYWGLAAAASALVLDEATAEFSLVTFPENIWEPYNKKTFRIIVGEDGALRVVRLVTNDLKVFARRWRRPGSDNDDGDGGDEWVLEKHLLLPEATFGLPGREESFFQQEARIVAANTRYILVTPSEKNWLFSVELDTMRVEREHERNKSAGEAYPYELPWPPAFPDHCTGRRR